ncbi:hypothetical protein GCM10023231_17790 [Olivibacter ginsenosidimutans]|uniref:Uncharacterized protein n=1 Tax=Olivibacter ginsenosidimutans TaxID=1176537 RepID=A0ABP9B7L4_9SPHI
MVELIIRFKEAAVKSNLVLDLFDVFSGKVIGLDITNRVVFFMYARDNYPQFEFCTNGFTNKSNSKRVAFVISAGSRTQGFDS